MTNQPPLPPGPGPYVVQGQGAPGGPPFHGAYPAYVGYPVPAPRSAGLNPWVAGLIGVFIGGIGAMALTMVLPMLFFGFLTGGLFGADYDEGEVGPMDGAQRVSVAADGSVSGAVLAEVLAEDWYEDLTCPDTPKVATDVTTICRGGGRIDDLRVVVVFRDSSGLFSTADAFP